MNTFNKLKSHLDTLSTNQERRNYFESIKNNPIIHKSDLRILAIKIMEEENFIEKYYGKDKTNLMVRISNFYNVFSTYIKSLLKRYKKL